MLADWRAGSGPRARRLTALLRSAIEDGALVSGTRLPPERTLAAQARRRPWDGRHRVRGTRPRGARRAAPGARHRGRARGGRVRGLAGGRARDLAPAQPSLPQLRRELRRHRRPARGLGPAERGGQESDRRRARGRRGGRACNRPRLLPARLPAAPESRGRASERARAPDLGGGGPDHRRRAAGDQPRRVLALRAGSAGRPRRPDVPRRDRRVPDGRRA